MAAPTRPADMIIYMGIVRLPQLELYWSSKHDLSRQNISEIMTLVRFQQILKFFHLNNSNEQVSVGQPGYDPLFKVRKILDIVTFNFDMEYNLGESISVDEAMIPFKGRLSFKQYMKDKPVKHGIKVFVLSMHTGAAPPLNYRLALWTDLAVGANGPFIH